MNTPFEDHHKIVTKNEAMLTAARRYATRSLRHESNFRHDFTTPM